MIRLTAATYTYDDAGRLALVDYGNGSTIAYTYDKAGNLVNRTVTTSAPASQAQPAKSEPAQSKESISKPAPQGPAKRLPRLSSH